MENGNELLSSSNFASSSYTSNGSSDHNMQSAGYERVASLELLSSTKLSGCVEKLLIHAEFDYSDAEIVVEGTSVGVNRCILAPRSPFFHELFKKCNAGSANESKPKYVLEELVPHGKVGSEAFMVFLNYVYTGKLRPSPPEVSTCVDESCAHDACGPAINYAVELMYASATFQMEELVLLFQHRLSNFVDKAFVEDVIPIVAVAFHCQLNQLLSHSIQRVARSDLDDLTLEKELPHEILTSIKSIRKQSNRDLERDAGEVNLVSDERIRRIHKALDSGDIELLKLLLEESDITLDDAFALHYAAAYCNPRVVGEVLSLGHADLNLRNARGYTVLHVAARRKDPLVIVSLLSKGASVSDYTMEGQTAVMISGRLTRPKDYRESTQQGQETNNVGLCIDILESSEVPSLENADLNLRNARGYTVLHVAARRKDLSVIGGLPSKEASVSDSTMEGQTALTICRRLTRLKDYLESTQQGQETNKDRLCIEVLVREMLRNPLAGNMSMSSMMVADDLLMRLLLLENRVALARVLFPREARLAMEIAKANSTLEFAGLAASKASCGNLREVDLNEIPHEQVKRLQLRLQALQKTVETSRHFFPNCSGVLDRFLEDDMQETLLLEKGKVMKAFDMDKAEYNWVRFSSSFSCSSSPKASANHRVRKRNARGYTVIHVGARRKDPSVIVGPLSKEASVSDSTMEGQTAITICRRLTGPEDYHESTQQGQDTNKDRLCIDVLEREMLRNPLAGKMSMSSMMVADDLLMRLQLLESTVALARVLFPREARQAMEKVNAHSTSEFAGLAASKASRGNPREVDLNEIPHEQVKRLQSLQKTVETGRRFFPNCSEVLDRFLEDDMQKTLLLEKGPPEEQSVKKMRYMELKDEVMKAFDKDKAENKWASFSSSSSCSSSPKASANHRVRKR